MPNHATWENAGVQARNAFRNAASCRKIVESKPICQFPYPGARKFARKPAKGGGLPLARRRACGKVKAITLKGIAMNYRQVTLHPESRIAPNATLVGNVSVEKDATILFGATLRGDYGSRIVVGEGSNIQENACVHLDYDQDCIVGRGVTVGHGAVIHGCFLEDNVLVGMGAVVMNGAVIGKNSLVAAGALVTEGTIVPSGSLVVGCPGKVRRQLTPEEIEANRVAAEGYAQIGADLVENGIIYAGKDVPRDLMTIALAE